VLGVRKRNTGDILVYVQGFSFDEQRRKMLIVFQFYQKKPIM